MRIFTKITLWALVILIAIIGIWFAANRLLDESPNKDRIDFYELSTEHVPDEQNIAIGMLGLTAPAGSDFMKYGAKIEDLYKQDKSYDRIPEITQDLNSLKLTVNSDQVWCWIDHQIYTSDDCIPFYKAPDILQENQELLERYRSLQYLEGYSSLFVSNNQTFLILLKMNLADIQIDLERGEYKKAYEKWRDQLQLSRTILRGQDTWVGKAIGLVTFGFTYPLLEEILLAAPKLAKEYSGELTTLLQPEGIDGFNIEGIMHAEFTMLVHLFKYPPSSFGENSLNRLNWIVTRLSQKDRILNRYYSFSRDYADALQLSWSQQENVRTQLSEKHPLLTDWDIIVDPFGSLFLTQVIDGQLAGYELFRSLYIAEGRLRLASLFIRIINEDLSDDEIAGMLTVAGANYFDPFTNTPMKWDADKKTIYFPNPQNKCVPHASFRIPDSKHLVNTTDTDEC
jgi:hypothetical protein